MEQTHKKQIVKQFINTPYIKLKIMSNHSVIIYILKTPKLHKPHRPQNTWQMQSLRRMDLRETEESLGIYE
jgi:hypothetical protein